MARWIAALVLAGTCLAGCTTNEAAADKPAAETPRAEEAEPAPQHDSVRKTDAAWRAQLDDLAYRVLREAGTEPPFTSPLTDEHRTGQFVCAGCALPLFRSTDKFDSGTGWPSYSSPIDAGSVVERADEASGMTRTEVRCGRCEGHLGHVFDDGPRPTGLRYCINGAALKFEPSEVP